MGWNHQPDMDVIGCSFDNLDIDNLDTSVFFKALVKSFGKAGWSNSVAEKYCSDSLKNGFSWFYTKWKN